MSRAASLLADGGRSGVPDLLERVDQIGLQIVDIFNTNRQTDQRICDPKGGALLRGYRGVRHDRGMFDQTFDSSQALRKGENTAGFQEPARSAQPAFQL